MGRPLAVAGFSYMAALAVALFVGVMISFWLALLLEVVFIGVMCIRPFRKQRVIPIAVLAAAAALVCFGIYTNTVVRPTEPLQGSTCQVQAELCELPYNNGSRNYYTVTILSVKGKEVPDKIKAVISTEEVLGAEPFDKINGKVKFFENENNSYQQYQISQKIMLSGSIDRSTRTEMIPVDTKPLYYDALMIRSYINDQVDELFSSEQAGLINAVLTGNKEGLSYENKSDFAAAGVSHIAAVSGFHLTVVIQLFTILLSFLCQGKRVVSNLLSIAFVLTYMAMVGFSPSVVRAGLMQITILSGKMIYRQADPINTLGLAVILICGTDPYAAANIGFVLSAASTLGIQLFYNRINTYLSERILSFKPSKNISLIPLPLKNGVKKLLQGMVSVTAVTASTVPFTLPLTIIYFQKFSLYSFLTNVLVCAAVSLLIMGVFFILLLHPIIPFAAMPLVIVCSAVADYIMKTVDFVADWPLALLNTSYCFVPVWLIGMLLLFTVLLLFKPNRDKVICYILTAIFTFAVGNVSYDMVNIGTVKLAIRDTGNGLSVVLAENDEIGVLYCGGDNGKSSVLTNYTQQYGEKYTNIFLLAENTPQTAQYAEKYLQKNSVERVLLYDSDDYSYQETILFDQAGEQRTLHHNGNEYVLTTADHTKLFIYRGTTGSAVCVNANGKQTLICTDGTDCSQLPVHFLESDYLVINGKVTQLEQVQAHHIIISDTKDHLPLYGELADREKAHIYATADQGGLALVIRPNGDTTVRRENEWLS